MTVSKWTDLDWVNIDPTDRRYYQSLLMALHERLWHQPLTPPLATNTYPWYQVGTQNGRRRLETEYQSRLNATSPWQLGATPSVDIFANLHQLFLDVAFGTYAYSGTQSNPQPIANYVKPIHRQHEGDWHTSQGGGWWRPLTMDDIWNADTAGMLSAPLPREIFAHNDNAVKFLKSMKSAIQQLRYIPIVGGNTYVDIGANYDTAYDHVRFATLDEAVEWLMANMMTTSGATTHNPHQSPWSHWRLSRYYGLRSTGLYRHEQRWTNTFNFPVDLYARIYSAQTFLDFGSGLEDGEIISFGKYEIGDTLEGVFGIDTPTIPDLPVEQPSGTYSVHAILMADAGHYFDFNCDD